MDVKSAFLYGKIEEEVYVCQPLGFEDPDFPDRMSSMGELTFFLGLEDGIFISQDKYVTEILKKFGFTDVKIASTPIHLYRSMIGSLMYLTSSRPDIMFTMCACARYQVNPKVSQLHAVKRIFRYLKGQPKLGLWYPKDSPFDLVAYTDSDYARASLDRKSTTGGWKFLGCRLISWQCKKQNAVANSTTEAEYIAASSCCGQNGIGVNTGDSKLMLLGINLLLLGKVNVVRHKLTTAGEMKTVNGEVQLQALMDGKKIIITEAIVKRDLQLEDAEGIDCPPNADIFEQITLIGYEKLSHKLTFYKAFFSPQWKFLIHTDLQCLSAKTTTWNEFSSTMASAIIIPIEKKLIQMIKIHTDKNVVDLLTKAFDKEIRVNTGDSKLMLLGINLLLLEKVNATRHNLLLLVFWATAKVETVNGEVQLHALVDRKKVIITESTINKDLQLKDVEKFNFSKYIFESMVIGMIDSSCANFYCIKGFVQVFLDKQVGDMSTHDEIFVTPSHTKKVFGNMKRVRKGFSGAVTHFIYHNGSSSGKKWVKVQLILLIPITHPFLLNHQHLNPKKQKPRKPKRKDTEIPQSSGPTEPIANKTSNEENTNRVLDLEHTKTTQALEIESLKRRMNKLEKKQRSRTPKLKRLFKEEDPKQGRKITALTNDEEVTLVDENSGELVLPATITTEEITLAQALAELRSAKPKVVVQEPVQSTTTTTPSTIPKLKALLLETLMKEQIRLDEELAFKLQAEEEEQARLAREKAEKVEEANISWDNVQAMIEADRLLAERLQAECKNRAQKKAEASMAMKVVLKEQDKGQGLKDKGKANMIEPEKPLKKKDQIKFDEEEALRLQAAFDEEDRLKRKKSQQAEEANIAWDDIQAKIDADYQMSNEIIPDKEKVVVDAIPLDTKPPSIVDYKIIKEGKINYYQIIRANRSSKRYSAFIQMLRSFDREDLETLWKLVKAKHGRSSMEESTRKQSVGLEVHFVRFQSLHVFMLVEKRYPLTPATITEMLNKKLQADHWNEMYY
ncbi:hypothetical protein Tco_0205975, partial [Tanacetum coccineum]